MKRKTIKKIAFKITEGMFDRIVDVVLLTAYYFKELSPLGEGTLYERFIKVSKDFEKFDSETLKRAFKKTQKEGWLSDNLRVTKKGQERLNLILPEYEKQKKWDKKWYIVTYDIPESKKYLRNILRDNLKRLKFGQLHKSLWISPYNFLGDIEKILMTYKMEDYVVLAISEKLGREPSSELARRIWGLDKINDDYEIYIKDIKFKKLSKKEAIFKYLIILNSDPQLPKEILFDGWKGEEANKIYKKFIS